MNLLSALKPSLKGKITVLVIFLFLVSSIVTGFVIQNTVVVQYEAQIGESAMSIARSVALIPEIYKNVGIPGGASVIQPLADGIRSENKFEFVVVIDMNGIRYSHKVPERIGKKMVGGDEGPALKGQSYLSRAIGTLGPSLRAFTPIYRDGRQVGAVLVGILLDQVRASSWKISLNVLLGLGLGLIVGVLGAAFLADSVKRSIRGLEPEEINRMLWEREAMLESVREGIIAVDEEGKLTLVNSEARRLLDLPGSGVVGQNVNDMVPNTRLTQILKTGETEYDREQRILDVRILTNRVPIKSDDRVIGAMASFRDMSEITFMAEELTGVKKYVDALRVRNHEFLNKLQTISGLIQLGESDKAVTFISDTVKSTQSVMSFITRRIKNPSVGGLLLGKMGRCKELGIELTIDPDSYLAPSGKVDGNALVVIIGNLVENSMNALLNNEKDDRRIELAIFDESSRILISVRDNGPGIDQDYIEKVFERGFSTKSDGHGGYGLYNLKTLVDAYDGEINLVSEPLQFTEFVINLPNGGSNNG